SSHVANEFLANTLNARHAHRQALGFAERAIDLDATCAGGRFARTESLEGLGRGDDALAEVGRALAVHPTSDVLRRKRASLLERTGSPTQALAEYARVLEDKPGDPTSIL